MGSDDELPPNSEDVHRVEYDSERDESPSAVVVNAVAAVTGRTPTEITPLYEVVDPDALDDLYEPARGESSQRSGSVTFHYEGCRITVHQDGDIVIESRNRARNNGG